MRLISEARQCKQGREGNMDLGADLYRKFVEGDDEAFEELISAYSKNLLFFINGYVRDLPASEDLMEDTFLDLYVHKGRYEKLSASFKTYLFRIARNKAFGYLRFKRRVTVVPPDADCLRGETEDVENAVLKEERLKTLSSAMEDMRVEYREVLELVFIEDMSYDEAAKVVKKSVKQVTNLVYRAKLQLKDILKKEDQYED